MKHRKSAVFFTLMVSLFVSVFANATMVQQMNLGELTSNADKIFRGTVIKVESGTITAGGAELSTVKYIIQVSDLIKGNISSSGKEGGDTLELTMLGRLKEKTSQSTIKNVAGFKLPVLKSGSEYLLFTTTPSQLGLSMMVGVGQGTFRFVEDGKVMNEAKNAGLFRDMNNSRMAERGAVTYSNLTDEIKDLIAKQGGK